MSSSPESCVDPATDFERQKGISVVIPAFNESATIRDIASRTLLQCENVIVVDDGSTDGTSTKLEGLDIKIIRHERNLRKAAALWTGIRAAIEAGADAVITLDGDGQHFPEDIPALLRAADRNPGTIVIGSRLHNCENRPVSRYRANRIANFWVSWAAGYQILDSQSGFRLYPAGLLDKLTLPTDASRGFVFESEILIEAARHGVLSCAVDISVVYSDALRASHFRPVSDIANITFMVAGRLLRRGMFVSGLYNSYFKPKFQALASVGFDRDALIALTLSMLAALSTFGLLFLYFVFRVHRTAARAPLNVAEIDAVIVLGHELVSGNISSEYYMRLDRALQLCRANPAIDIYIAGGRPNRGVTEAEAGKRYLAVSGIDPDRICGETLSSNTFENLRQIRPVIKAHQKVAIVSSRYHLERIATIARGMRIELNICAAEPSYRFFEVISRSLIEAFFLHWYWAARTLGHLTSNSRILEKIGRESSLS